MFLLNCKGKLTNLSTPVVMGIINVTPDSFYSGSRAVNLEAIVAKASAMIEAGAIFLDIGGQSTRPGSRRITAVEEEQRVLPAIEAIIQKFPESIVSIDTYYGSVARAAVAAGASVVNDVSAGSMDESIIKTVADLGVPYILMHMKGEPESMQQAPFYQNVVTEVFDALNNKISLLHQAGIKDIIIDPGFGFGKTAAHNFAILNHLSWFRQLGRPLLVGLSRKGTIYKTLNTNAAGALNGTTVLNTIALQNGADILRVHDVKEAVEAIKLVIAGRQ